MSSTYNSIPNHMTLTCSANELDMSGRGLIERGAKQSFQIIILKFTRIN